MDMDIDRYKNTCIYIDLHIYTHVGISIMHIFVYLYKYMCV
jgi:hypothetical protein